MNAKNRVEAWEIAYKVADVGMYRLDKDSTERVGYGIYRSDESCYSQICDLGCRLEVVKTDGSSINVWIEAKPAKATKSAPYRALVHYTEKNGNSQTELQRLAADVLNYGKRVSECRHVSQEFHPDGTKRVIPTGSYCVEALNEATGARYWIYFNGCRVTEIIEEYLKD